MTTTELRRLARLVNKGCDAPYYHPLNFPELQGKRIQRMTVTRLGSPIVWFLGNNRPYDLTEPERIFDGNGQRICV